MGPTAAQARIQDLIALVQAQPAGEARTELLTECEALGRAGQRRTICLGPAVDSSAVVAMMAQSSDTPVNTCAIAFDDHLQR